MYSYTFDPTTGGIILNSTPTNFSKEPRPVYAQEMDILGFDEYWNYEKQNDRPYMWAEANAYWYRGIQVAKTKGGNLYTAPELLPVRDESGDVLCSDAKLEPIDIEAMCEANRDLMTIVEESTVKKIVKEYEKFKNKLDIFHVAFSGGKDSAVLLDLVKKALPKESFVVIFGDTGMEFPDTYAAVEYTKKQCEEDGTPFYIARSHFDPKDSWKIFGPPSRTLRWCCSVHKSTPQTIKMREIVGRNNYTGLDFVGVRKHESVARSTYEYENFGKKQKGQYSFNPILEWTSAEVWLYMYKNNIYINDAYKKGNPRVGCLCCPMASSTGNFFSHYNYAEEVDDYVSIIRSMNSWDTNEKDLKSYVVSGGWISRRSGRGVIDNRLRYHEKHENGKLIIELIEPNSTWEEWMKTADISLFPHDIHKQSSGVVFTFDESCFKSNPTKGKFIRQALKKAAYCVGCRVCETNCVGGHISFSEGHIRITNCTGCRACHDIPAGCHAYNSLKLPQGEKKMKSIDCFGNHAIKRDWLVSFFDSYEDFFSDNALGPNMLTHFKRFLRDANLINNNCLTSFSQLVRDIGWDTETGLGLMLINLVYTNAQFEWYTQRFDIGTFYGSKDIKEELIAEGFKTKSAGDIVQSFKRIVSTPFGTKLNFGYVTDEDDLVRTKCSISDNKVILYALYKFAEKCNLDKEFNVSYLYDESVERDGISPVRIFGLYDEEEFKSIMLGLSSAYPEYLNATFTNDLQTITLRDKTSEDVLNLFKEDI